MRFVVALLSSLALMPSAYAAYYPTKPVKVIVGWAPGGIGDIAARIVAQKLTEKWGQQVLVENRPGASGMIANGVAARAPADGYTLMMATSPEVTTTPFIQKNAPRYFVENFDPVALVSVNPMVFVTGAKGDYKTTSDLVAAAKKQPGEIAYSSAGVGSAPHLAAEVLAERTGIKLKHIPYKGGAPAAVAVAGGEVPVGFMAMGAAIPYVKSGRVNVLGLSTAKRVGSVPDWPTLSESGVKDFDYTVWTGLFVQKGTPADIVRKIDTDLRAVLAMPEVAKQFEAVGAVAGQETRDAFVQRIKRDTAENEEVVRKADIRAE